MRQILFAALLLLAACAPPAATLSPIAAPHTFDVRPSFEAKAAQHVHHLSSRYKHGHAEAIAYIYNYSALARRVQHEYGIPAQITLAVGLLESGKGGSNIAVCARNHFGIKRGDGWHGEVYVAGDGAAYRVFGDAPAAFVGFADYVCERLPFFVGRDITAAEFAHSYGCARPKQYAKKINLIIARYGLKTLFEND